MAVKTPEAQAEMLICNTSFVGFYDGDGFRQFNAQQGRTIISSDSEEAKLWGDGHDATGRALFIPATPTTYTAPRDVYPVEQATAGPGEKRN